MQQKPRKHYLEESHLEVFSTLFPTVPCSHFPHHSRQNFPKKWKTFNNLNSCQNDFSFKKLVLQFSIKLLFLIVESKIFLTNHLILMRFGKLLRIIMSHFQKKTLSRLLQFLNGRICFIDCTWDSFWENWWVARKTSINIFVFLSW